MGALGTAPIALGVADIAGDVAVSQQTQASEGVTMSEAPVDVLVAGYQDVDAARRDFDGLVGLVNAKTVTVEGVILVAHDTDGNVTVVETGDHVGRKGGVGARVAAAARNWLICIHLGRATRDPGRSKYSAIGTC
jgi:hypothetical protein